MSFLNTTDPAQQIEARAARICLAVFDVDGVMTDGKLYLGPDGDEIKTMHVRDGLGLKRLMQAGVTVAVISGRPSTMVARRMDDLGIEHVFLGSNDKIADYETVLARLELQDEQAAMMGDDLPDLDLMRRVGLALTVADATPPALAAAHWASQRDGGEGAVREACELIIDARSRDSRSADDGSGSHGADR